MVVVIRRNGKILPREKTEQTVRLENKRTKTTGYEIKGEVDNERLSNGSTKGGLDLAICKADSLEDCVNSQLKASWPDIQEVEAEDYHRWFIRDYRWPDWEGIQYKDKEKALKDLRRQAKTAYLYYYVPELEELQEVAEGRRADFRYQNGFG